MLSERHGPRSKHDDERSPAPACPLLPPPVPVRPPTFARRTSVRATPAQANKLGGHDGACRSSSTDTVPCEEAAGNVLWLSGVVRDAGASPIADLVVSVAPGSAYEPSTTCDTACNGIAGSFLKLNVRIGTSANLRFSFVRRAQRESLFR